MFADTSDKPGVGERYSTAVSSSNLVVTTSTRMSDTDVLGAMGIADRELTEGRTSDGDPVVPAPLAVALLRLLVGGDNRAAHTIVRTMAEMAWREARGQRVKLSRVESLDMAKAVLAWFRNGTCRPCGGHGVQLIPGTKTHSDRSCPSCNGRGKRPLEAEFKPSVRGIVSWMASEIERESGRAGPRAMVRLAKEMDL